jgi:benzoyl-CoA reductase/2-hydroxyglutaryl-CoA dehydratase subunit BcrC/BadD/HgdB
MKQEILEKVRSIREQFEAEAWSWYHCQRCDYEHEDGDKAEKEVKLWKELQELERMIEEEKGGDIRMKELEKVQELKEKAKALLEEVAKVEKELREEPLLRDAARSLERAWANLKDEVMDAINNAEGWLQLVKNFLNKRREER